MAMELTNLTSMLFERSTGSGAYTAGLYFYSPGVDDPEYLPYQDLWTEAARRSRKIQGLTDLKNNPVIILHLEDHRESILWFWAIITAGAIPCLSTPLTNDMSQREKHMTHLQRLLGYPLIIASDKLE
jgi:acyl-CoA synthetase (AMP-forming)/AMP-acid ligase II